MVGNTMKDLFDRRTWDSFVGIGDINEVGELPQEIQQLVSDIENVSMP
jgi:hypothetical protein